MTGRRGGPLEVAAARWEKVNAGPAPVERWLAGVAGEVCKSVCVWAEMTDCFFICATQHSSRAINRLWLAARRLKGKTERRGDRGWSGGGGGRASEGRENEDVERGWGTKRMRRRREKITARRWWQMEKGTSSYLHRILGCRQRWPLDLTSSLKWNKRREVRASGFVF